MHKEARDIIYVSGSLLYFSSPWPGIVFFLTLWKNIQTKSNSGEEKVNSDLYF